MKFVLHKTCGACPEQYDVYLNGVQVAYFRLRHGTFRVDVPGCGGETIWTTRECEGNGTFADDERDVFLRAALCAVAAALANQSIEYEVADKPPGG